MLSARKLLAVAGMMATPSPASTVASTEFMLFSSLCRCGEKPLSLHTRTMVSKTSGELVR